MFYTNGQMHVSVGNQMLNRASALLQRLEDDDAAVAAAVAASSSSSSSPQPTTTSQDHTYTSARNTSDDSDMQGILDDEVSMELDEDDPVALQRIISQVVNASSAAALVAAVGQFQGGGGSGNGTPDQPVSNNASSGAGNSTSTVPSGQQSGGEPVARPVNDTSNNENSSSGRPTIQVRSRGEPGQQMEAPRLRELAIALQDFLAFQDRLNPFLRFVQDSLRQNRLYTEQVRKHLKQTF